MVDQNKKPLVSIITPVYNSSQFISSTIKSVLSQTFTDWELLIVDDCSLDDSVDIVKSFMGMDNRIKLIKLDEKSGPAIARNTAIKAAKGRYIAFLDSDDLWLDTFLIKAVEFIRNNNYSFVFSSYKRYDEHLNPKLNDFIVPKKVGYLDILKTCPIPCLTAIYDTKTYGKFYMPNIAKRQDYALWLAILKKVEYAYGIQEPLAVYRIRDKSVSRNKMKTTKYQWIVYRKIEGLSLFKSIYYIICYAYYGYIKYKT